MSKQTLSGTTYTTSFDEPEPENLKEYLLRVSVDLDPAIGRMINRRFWDLTDAKLTPKDGENN